MIKKLGDIEIYHLDENLNNLSMKEKTKRIDELFKKEYRGKEIKYLLNDSEINAFITSITRSNFNSRLYQSYNNEKKKEFNVKQEITLSGDFIPLISNLKYEKESRETKSDQNKSHKVDNIWYYFKKIIICNNLYYYVIVDIKFNNKKYIIYNIKIKEASALNKVQVSHL